MNQSYNFVFRPATATESGKWIEETSVTPSGGTAVTIIGPPTSPLTPGAGADVIPAFVFAGAANPNGLLTASVISGNGLIESEIADPTLRTATVQRYGLALDEGQSANAIFVNAVPLVYNGDSDALNAVNGHFADTAAILRDEAFGLSTIGFGYGLDGANWKPLKTGSSQELLTTTSNAAQVVTRVGDWSLSGAGAADTDPIFVSKDAVDDIAHVCTSISARLVSSDGTDTTMVLVQLSSDEEILWQEYLILKADGADTTGIAADRVSISGLNIVGTLGADLTLGFSAGSGAGTFQSVAMTGYSAENTFVQPPLPVEGNFAVTVALLAPSNALAGYNTAAGLGANTGALDNNAMDNGLIPRVLLGGVGPDESLQIGFDTFDWNGADASIEIWHEDETLVFGPRLLSTNSFTLNDDGAKIFVFDDVDSSFMSAEIGDSVTIYFDPV